MAEQRHGNRDSWELTSGSASERQRENQQWEWREPFKTAKPASRDMPLPVLPKQLSNKGPSIKP